MIKLHDEQRDDEIYLGDATQDYFDKIGWRSKRQGTPCETCEPAKHTPVFIKREEVEAAMKSSSHPGIVALYKRMLATGDGRIKKHGTDAQKMVIEITETKRDIGENRMLVGFELHSDIVPVEIDGELHEDTNLSWLAPMIVNTIRWILDSTFANKISSELTITSPGAPTNTKPIEQVIEEYATGADVEFPKDLDDPTALERIADILGYEFPKDLDDRTSGPF